MAELLLEIYSEEVPAKIQSKISTEVFLIMTCLILKWTYHLKPLIT